LRKKLENIAITANETHRFTTVIDRTPPKITILSPANKSFINSSNITITWNATDNIALSHFEVLLDDISYINTTEKEITMLNLSEGFHSVEVIAYDLANNSASSKISFVIDTIAPSISEFSINPSFGFTCTVYNFSAKINDETSGVKEVTAKLISFNFSLVLNLTKENNEYFGSISNLNPSNYFIEIKAIDNAGNIAYKKASFNITSYVLNWLSPINLTKSFNLGSTIPMKFSLHDELNKSFVSDTSVEIEVFDPNNMLIFNSTYGKGDDFVRINYTEQYYITNFHSNKERLAGNYLIRVRFENNLCHAFEKIITLESKRGKKK